MKNKNVLALLVAMVLCFALSACGSSDSGTSETSNLKEVVFDEGTVVLENEYVKVELVKFFEEEVNWSGEEPAIEKNITLKVTNLSDVEMIFGFNEVYIGDEGADVLMIDGNSGPLPGKTKTYSYHIQIGDAALESLDDLYQFNGQFEIHVMSADGEYIEDTIYEMFDFSVLK